MREQVRRNGEKWREGNQYSDYIGWKKTLLNKGGGEVPGDHFSWSWELSLPWNVMNIPSDTPLEKTNLFLCNWWQLLSWGWSLISIPPALGLWLAYTCAGCQLRDFFIRVLTDVPQQLEQCFSQRRQAINICACQCPHETKTLVTVFLSCVCLSLFVFFCLSLWQWQLLGTCWGHLALFPTTGTYFQEM